MSNKRAIAKELRLAGANPSETAGLIKVAADLGRLKGQETAYDRRDPGRHRWHMASLGITAAAGILLGAVLIAYAQTSLPGSWLYPPKRLSEKVAVAVDPNYRATLMMRRSQEVRQLVDRHAGRPLILATLADYRTEAAAYKSTNYAAFEFCKSNLQQAATSAPATEQAAINSTLASLQT